jgi:two-component system, probable response regulator PhcQ
MNENKILVVDDEENIIKAIRRTFIDDAVEIVGATSGAEGLKMLAKDDDIDLVISDYKMPQMNGIEFLSRVQHDFPNVLTIILTAYGDIETAMQAINEVGAYKFILKPWNDSELRITVKRALELDKILKERNLLQRTVKRQDIVLKAMEKKYPGISEVEYDEDGNRIFKLK